MYNLIKLEPSSFSPGNVWPDSNKWITWSIDGKDYINCTTSVAWADIVGKKAGTAAFTATVNGIKRTCV